MKLTTTPCLRSWLSGAAIILVPASRLTKPQRTCAPSGLGSDYATIFKLGQVQRYWRYRLRRTATDTEPVLRQEFI